MEADQLLQEAKHLYFQLIGNKWADNVERPGEALLTQLGAVKEDYFDALIHISQR